MTKKTYPLKCSICGEKIGVKAGGWMDGNNAEQGRHILDSAANPLVERVDTMDGAARRAAELAAAGV